MAAEMTERRRLLLKLVIQEHIEHPEPGGVGSDTLVRKYGRPRCATSLPRWRSLGS
jgi:transcriptional regulator of heat shock response